MKVASIKMTREKFICSMGGWEYKNLNLCHGGFDEVFAVSNNCQKIEIELHTRPAKERVKCIVETSCIYDKPKDQYPVLCITSEQTGVCERIENKVIDRFLKPLIGQTLYVGVYEL